jgi:hypothetical protein
MAAPNRPRAKPSTDLRDCLFSPDQVPIKHNKHARLLLPHTPLTPPRSLHDSHSFLQDFLAEHGVSALCVSDAF